MDRKAAIALFGSISKTAKALEVSRNAVNKWPDQLPLRIADRVRGAWYRTTKNAKNTARHSA